MNIRDHLLLLQIRTHNHPVILNLDRIIFPLLSKAKEKNHAIQI